MPTIHLKPILTKKKRLRLPGLNKVLFHFFISKKNTKKKISNLAHQPSEKIMEIINLIRTSGDNRMID
ncbi:hypothetical protein BpHYR1_051188 [Brachionus plicatilis]|uniref:Uncharacterized protein n=1 Tax=Brachionus plicatilis TaxID=10195 RepID=A0A3M7QRB2_BRAPC|nr:hypothetical protein BpHYR1_051188 [Brachionus plicatilis]